MIDFIFTADNVVDLPDEDFRVIVHKSVEVIPRRAFNWNQHIVELICHSGVGKIEELSFFNCHRLRRLIIPGVKIVEGDAFNSCEAVNYVECPLLEIIGEGTFAGCKSLSGIDLPSAKVVEDRVFIRCAALTDVKFGKDLESIRWAAFRNCPSLERITIPLKDGVITDDNAFQGCVNLNRVDLVEEKVLHETIDALQLEEWRNDMNEEIDSINQILPHARAGDPDYDVFMDGDEGEKVQEIREWVARVLRKVIEYKAEHRRIVNEASTTLQFLLPRDIVINNIIPFIELPPHTFDGENEEDEEEEEEEQR